MEYVTMDTETARTLPIDAHLICREETDQWHFNAELQQYIEHIWTVLVFDKNEHTYCCEMTPSYTLYPVDTFALIADTAPEWAVDAIDNDVSWNSDRDVKYVHVYEIDAWIEAHPGRETYHHYGATGVSYEDTSYDEQIEALIEHFNCNAAF